MKICISALIVVIFLGFCTNHGNYSPSENLVKEYFKALDKSNFYPDLEVLYMKQTIEEAQKFRKAIELYNEYYRN